MTKEGKRRQMEDVGNALMRQLDGQPNEEVRKRHLAEATDQCLSAPVEIPHAD